MNALHRASFNTGAAAGTFGVINLRQIVNYMDGIIGAGTLTFTAGDTTIFAGCPCFLSIGMAGAYDVHLSGKAVTNNQMLWTFWHTDTAAGAEAAVDHRYAILDFDRMIRTYSGTIAKPQAAVSTVAVSGI